MNPMNIAVAGASGRMGRMLIEAIAADPDARLAGALDIATAPGLGTDAAAFSGQNAGVLIESDLAKGLAHAPRRHTRACGLLRGAWNQNDHRHHRL